MCLTHLVCYSSNTPMHYSSAAQTQLEPNGETNMITFIATLWLSVLGAGMASMAATERN
ncbi:hypothetical protein PbB2_02477 [Candidatus Phycosocius bacilliformis]|uniref:Uncharacterized protein n=1 Tax=Candidatus Phycosocius bacilliformis TaxID=1445552 RepID=A0A2P2ECJ3_9PROT|nr:hypothetical protein PbB2_02477 [Candidatus Phycosocius bacilliformis]